MTTTVKRILHIEANEDHTVGGSHQALYDLVLNIDRSRYEPVVLFYQENVFADRLRGVCEVATFEAERAAERQAFLAGGRLRKLATMARAIASRRAWLRDHRIDLVHINNSPVVGNDDWLPAAKLVGIPCIANVMGDAAGESKRLRRRLFRSFDHVLPISDYMTAAMAGAGIPAHRMTQVYLGVDAERTRSRVSRSPSAVRSELSLRNDEVLVTMVGNIREWKGQHVVLDALTRLPESDRERLCVAFIGATAPAFAAYEQQLRDTVAREGLSACVRFVGGRSDVADFYNAADIAVHASIRPEPFGLVVVEAMALGTPVVAANTGGPSEVVTAESGRTFDPARPEQLAEILQQLAADAELRAALGRGAIERANDFSIAAYVAGIEAVYAQLFRGRRAMGARPAAASAERAESRAPEMADHG